MASVTFLLQCPVSLWGAGQSVEGPLAHAVPSSSYDDHVKVGVTALRKP